MKPIFTFLSLFLFLEFSSAQIFVKHNASGTKDGSSWTNAFTDVQDALDAAQPGDQVWVAEGTYYPNGPTPETKSYTLKTAIDLYGGFAGTETILAQRDWAAHPTIFNGDIDQNDDPSDPINWREDNAHHILILFGIVEESIIDGITFVGGMTRTDTYAPVDSDLNGIDRWQGGAMAIVDATAIVRNCTFHDNMGYRGAGIFARSPALTSEGLIVENCLFYDNDNIEGGTCRISTLNYCLLKNCVFNENSAGSGAGIVFGNINITLEDCTFTGNTASTVGAACFIFRNQSSLIANPVFEFKNCTFSDNVANTYGGAIRLNNFAMDFTLNIDSCTFDGNQALNAYGGAIDLEIFGNAILSETPISVFINNSTFSNNTAAVGGGFTMLNADDTVNVIITNTVFSDNTGFAEGAGGVYLSSIGTATVNAELTRVQFFKQ